MNFEKQVKKVAKELIKINGKATTLEIKNELRKRFPNEKIYQKDVSDVMIYHYDNETIKGLGYSDNGSYRTYTMEKYIGTTKTSVVGVSIKTSEITKTQMAELLLGSNGDMVTVTYDKKAGDRRTMIGSIDSLDPFNVLGYIKMFEFGRDLKLVDPRTLMAIHINNVMYTLK